jgi:hypothetical protein
MKHKTKYMMRQGATFVLVYLLMLKHCLELGNWGGVVMPPYYLEGKKPSPPPPSRATVGERISLKVSILVESVVIRGDGITTEGLVRAFLETWLHPPLMRHCG